MKINTLALQGYEISEIPVKTVPKAWFKHRDGRIVELPANQYYLQYYLNKGLVLIKPPEKAGKSRKRR